LVTASFAMAVNRVSDAVGATLVLP
jgi:hypothetical protein